MSGSDVGKSGVRPLESFFDDSRTMDVEAFTKRNGEAFLVHHGSAGRFGKVGDTRNTIKVEGTVTRGGIPFNPRKDFAVFPVRHAAANTGDDDLIWVGRSEENDVVIPDESVSVVHAFIKKGEGGRMYLQDMNSMNGSFVNNETVPPQGMGEPLELTTGCRLRLGTVKLTFLKAPEFLAMVTQLRD